MIPESAQVLVLDHRDSFVFNLVDELRATGAVVTTLRSDLSLDELEHKIDSLSPRLVVLSPGPGTPEDVVTVVPASMRIVATTEEDGANLVRGLRHRERPRLGLQFHPESILTPDGRGIVWRFYEEALSHGGRR